MKRHKEGLRPLFGFSPERCPKGRSPDRPDTRTESGPMRASAPTIFTGSGASVSEALRGNRSHKGSNLNSITHQGWAVARTEYRKRSCLSRAAPFSFFLHLAALPFAGRYASPLGGSPQCAHWGIGARDSPPRARLRRLRFAISSDLNLSFFCLRAGVCFVCAGAFLFSRPDTLRGTCSRSPRAKRTSASSPGALFFLNLVLIPPA